MGYNSTVIVLNDALHDIERDEKFGKKLSDAVLSLSVRRDDRPVDVSAMNHANAASVIETHHADGMHLIAIGGNTGYDIGHMGSWKFNEEAMLRAWADKLGFEVHKKRSR